MEEREKLRAKWRDKEDDWFSYGNPADSELLQAAIVCAQALSRSRVDDKVRLLTLCKVLDGLGGDNMENKPHNPPVCEQAVQVQEKTSGGYAQHEKAQESSQQTSTESFVDEGQEKILSFLHKAIAHGALVLKDTNSVLRCVRDSSMETLRGKENAQHNDGYVQVHANSVEQEPVEIAGKTKHPKCLKEKDDPQCPLVKDPPVITQFSVPQETLVPAKGTLSFVLGDQGRNSLPSLHVPHGMADEKDKRGSHTQLQVKTTNCFSDKLSSKGNSTFMANSDKGEWSEALHVNPSLSPLSFLEAAKKNLKVSQSCSSQHERELEVQNAQPTSSLLEDTSIFRIEKEVFLQRMKMCRFSVVAKITLMKGDEPWVWKKLKEKLDGLWGLKTEWRLISLGKGFFHVICNSQEDLDRVWSKGILHLKPGVLRIQRWNFGFDPSKEKTTKAQVWFRIYNLPWCLWDSSVLNGIACKIGAPIRIDKATLEGSFGHYARILVEVDLSKSLKATVLTECNGQIFEVKIVPEHLPSFCKECLSIGHLASNCKFLNKNLNDAGTGKVPNNMPQFCPGCSSVEHTKNECKNFIKKGVSSLPSKRNRGEERTSKIVESIGNIKDVSKEEMLIKNQAPTVEFSRQNSDLNRFNGETLMMEIMANSHEEDGDVHSNSYRDSFMEASFVEITKHRQKAHIQRKQDKKVPLSNKFSVLCQEDERAGKAPGTDVALQKIRAWVDGQSHHVRDQIQSVKEKDHLVESSVTVCEVNDSSKHDQNLIPEIPARWSDILDEDDENEDAPLFLEMDFPAPICKSKLYHPYSPQESTGDDQKMSSQELQGNTIIGGTIITPISSKKSKKVKLGFRQPVGPICSSKR